MPRMTLDKTVHLARNLRGIRRYAPTRGNGRVVGWHSAGMMAEATMEGVEHYERAEQARSGGDDGS